MTSKSKRFTSLLGFCSLVAAAACLCMAGVADAQPGATPPGSVPPYSPPPSPAGPGPVGPGPAPTAPAPYYGPAYGPQQPPLPPAQKKKTRQGWNLGFSLGGGSMESSLGEFDCAGCESAPPALGFDFHVGTMLMPRLALQAEFWGQTRNLDENGNGSIAQQMFLLAAQYWLTPRFWIKAGVGFASLTLTYDNGFEDVSEPLDDGSAFMGAVGYEIMSSASFALDIQLKTGTGIYDARGEEVGVGMIALGLNWY